MDDQILTATRLSLHGVAESVIAGPQFRAHGTIRLAAMPGGFGGVAVPLRVEGTSLVWDGGRAPLTGTLGALAAAAGVELGTPGNYHDSPDLPADHDLAVDPAAAALIADAFARGDAAMRAFAPSQTPVLWPEHFDVGVTVDEVNYGVSPGDAAHPRPYAYVGPWTPPVQGGFWNAPFGALRPLDELPDARAVAAFFTKGRAAAPR
ncbi:MAG: hypothetical protein ACT4RN_08990 [Pseudonocardia sp.]